LLPVDLPPLSQDEAAHEAKVRTALSELLVREGGWLPFARFMDFVLNAPGLGYYAAGAQHFGPGGDFVTAPELSPVFARCLASSIAPVLRQLGGGDVLELGAGSGVLAQELVAALEREGAPPRRYQILEPSPSLRARQRDLLASASAPHRARIEWLERLPSVFAGVIVCNEVADALPVECFRIAAQGPERIGVAASGGRLHWQAGAADAALLTELAELEHARGSPFPTGFASEYAPLAGPWIGALAAPLERGALLVLDYGLSRREYYQDARARGTLACFFRQRVHEDPFINLGLQDVTAWVDFTRLALAGVAAGLQVAAFTTQAQFLLDAGFARHLAELTEGAEAGLAARRTRAAATLVLPSGMGERFKCLALSRGVSLAEGFRGRDFAAAL